MLFCMDLLVLFQILRTFEGLFADLAYMWLQRCVNYGEIILAAADGFIRTAKLTSKMAGNMVSLCTSSVAVDPLTGETEVVSRLSANVVVAEMVVKSLWVSVVERAVLPHAFVL